MRSTVMLLVALGLLLGCHTSAVDEHFGQAYRENVARMAADPTASLESVSVDGMAGTTATSVTENYHQNQKTEAQRERQKDSGILKVR